MNPFRRFFHWLRHFFFPPPGSPRWVRVAPYAVMGVITLLVIVGDHGYNLGEHGQWMKQTVFEPAARSPIIISGAGVSSRGRTCGRGGP